MKGSKVNMSTKKTHEEFIAEAKNKNPYFDDVILLSEYKNARTKIIYQCKICNTISSVSPSHFLRGAQCKVCSKRRHSSEDYFLERVSDLKDKIEFLNVKYENSNSKIDCRCKVCNQEWTTSATNLMYAKSKCPYCSHKILDENNNIFATRPDLRKYFVNDEDAKQSFEKSDKVVDFKCPDCGRIKSNKIKNVAINGFHCDYCSDGVSYPNKVIRNFMCQTPFQNVQFEYSPDWAGRYHYDVYFEFDNKKYVVEMDGELGHGKKQYRSKKKDIDGKQRDIIKDNLAITHNITMIRIDCKESNIEYIKSQMKLSILKDLLNLDLIDWELIDKQSLNSLLIQVCDYYEKQEKDIFKVSEHFMLNPATVRKYIHRGESLGLCKYDYEYSERLRLLKANGGILKEPIWESNKRQKYWDMISEKYWDAKNQGYSGTWADFRKKYRQEKEQEEILNRNKDSSTTDGSFIA